MRSSRPMDWPKNRLLLIRHYAGGRNHCRTYRQDKSDVGRIVLPVIWLLNRNSRECGALYGRQERSVKVIGKPQFQLPLGTVVCAFHQIVGTYIKVQAVAIPKKYGAPYGETQGKREFVVGLCFPVIGH